MLRKIFLSLTAMLVIALNVCAENISYDFTQNKINNAGSHSIVKKGEELYLSGEKDFVEISLEKGDKITLLRWNSYANIKPEADPAVYNVCDVIYMCDGEEVAKGIGFAEGDLVYPDVPQKDGYQVKWSVSKSGECDLTANAVYTPNKYKITFDTSDEEIEVTYDDKYPELPIPENTDISKYFIGWYNGEELVAKDNKVNITEDVCLVAKWGDKPAYKVTYNSYYQDGTAMLDSVIEGEKAIEPEDPEKTGYKFLYWCTDSSGDNKYDFETAIQGDVTLYPKWELVYYYIYFVGEDDQLVDTRTYTIEDEKVDEPEVPEKEGYSGKWQSYELNGGTLTIYAEYSLINYTVTFVADGQIVETESYIITNKKITEPAVPQKEGYTAVWESYSLNLEDITVKAIYIPVEYKVTFVAEGKTVAEKIYTVENKVVYNPEIPAKTGYTAAWEDYSLNLKNITVNAVYTPIEYTVKFVVDGVEISSSSYTVESEGVAEPAVPAKDWYDGKWETYSLEAGGITVNAVYTLATYTVSFKADGKEIATQSYDKNNQEINTPAIPAKTGYRAVWERFEVVPGGMTINVRYISAETDEENAEELKHFTNMVTDFGKHSFTGNKRTIVENIKSVGEGILKDIEYGIEITETHIKTTYQGIITATKEIYSGISDKTKFKGDVARLIKDDDTYDYFNDFYEKYF